MVPHDRRLAGGVRTSIATLAALIDRAAQGCRRAAALCLEWPARRRSARWNAEDARDPARWEGNWILGSAAMVVVSRLVYLLLALGVLLGEIAVNLARVPAVVGLPSAGGGSGWLSSLSVATAAQFLVVAAFLGALSLELWDVTPVNTHLTPLLRPGVRAVFRVIALVGFALSVLEVALIYVAGEEVLLQGGADTGLALLINGIQGALLTVAAVPSLWALILGALAALALLLGALWLLLKGLSLPFVALAGGVEASATSDVSPSVSPRLIADADPWA